MLNKLKILIKSHYQAVILVFVLGILAVLPHLYFIYSSGSDYRGINILKSSDEESYMSMVNRAANGHNNTLAPYLYEYRDANDLSVGRLEIFWGRIAALTGISVANLFLALKFLCPLVLVVLFYWLTYLIGKNKIAALLAPLLIIAGLGIIGAKLGTIKDVILWRGPLTEYWDFIRLLNPAFSGIFFLLAVLAIFYLFISPNVKRALLAGVIFGALFYIYLYFWTFIAVLVGVILIYALLGKNFKLFKYMSLAGALGLVIGAPQLFSLFNSFNKILIGASQAAGIGAVASHAPIREKLVLAVLVLYIIFIVFLRRRGEYKREFLFPVFLLAAGTIAVNQQIVTGKVIQPFHYYFLTNLPSAYIALAVIFGHLVYLIRQKFLRYTVIVAVFVVVFAWGIGVQASSYKYWAPGYRELQKYSLVFDWLTANAAEDSVIYGNDDITDLIPAYTPFFVYWSPYAGDSAYSPMERKESAYFINMRLVGLDASSGETYLRRRQNEVGQRFYSQYYRDLCGSYGCFPDGTMDKIVKDWQDFLRQPFEQEFKKYKVDYFVWDKNREPDWRIGDLKFLEPVYEYNGIQIFKVK